MRCALIHGFAGDPANWDEVLDHWQLPEEPIALALPGHGGGPVLAGWEANLAAIAGALPGCEVVIGYSLGARVALGLLANGHVASGVLIGVNPGVTEAERLDRKRHDAGWARMLRTEELEPFFEAWESQPLFETQQHVSSLLRAERRARRLRLDPEQLARSLEQLGLGAMPDYRPAVTAYRDRIALLAGGDDAKYVAIARGLPARMFETIPGSGHDPTLEQPALLAAMTARAVVTLQR
ncbi:2-succinyl-6-hydroxy-2,4-cyclohexadiene-1-carboxylate synthase [soil metagenome]